MKEQITKPLKLTFLIHFFAGIFLGIVFLLFTETFTTVTGWPYLDPVAGRIMGAALVGFSLGSLLAWRETEWESVKILVQVEIAWLGVGTVTAFICAFLFPVPWVIWVIIIIFLIFLFAFSYFYYIQEFR